MDEEDVPPAWFVAQSDRFKVGDRVEVVLGGECEHHGMPEISISMYRLTNGRTGTVEWIGRDVDHLKSEFEKTHLYWIRFDRPPVELLKERPHIHYGARFAAQELEPIDV